MAMAITAALAIFSNFSSNNRKNSRRSTPKGEAAVLFGFKASA